ncbi:MAG: hypothetical protein OIF57_06345 [Marinobacterium sp.]|nr:hypothetical protein [Marinobacterium sp.]
MSILILSPGDSTWTVPASTNSSNTVYGSSAVETVIVEPGANVTFSSFSNGDTLKISGSASDYTVHNSGATVYLTHQNGNTITLGTTPQATNIEFNNGALELKIDTTIGGIVLGEQLITSTPTDINLSNTHSQLLDVGTPEVPATLDAGSGNIQFTDDANVAGTTIINNFSQGDTITASNASSGDYNFSNNGADVIITFNNNGTLNSTTISNAVDSSALIFSEDSFEQAIGFDAFLFV